MKDAIIVRKETGSFSTKEMIGEEEMKRRVELFLIILLPILGLFFLGGKIMHLTKRPEQKKQPLLQRKSFKNQKKR